MSKRLLFLIVIVGLALIGMIYALTRPTAFSCESQFSVLQSINEDNIRAEGLIFFNMTDDVLLINIDGLLSHNNKKYLISRTLKISYKAYNTKAYLYKITHINIQRDNTDNVDDKIAINLLFGKGPDGKLIYLNKLNNNTILFGNHTFPQYGCKRK